MAYRKSYFHIKKGRLRDLNNFVASKIPNLKNEYLSADSFDEAELNKLNYPVELHNSLPGTSSLPGHRLCLKDGCMVMLLQNLQPNNGHINEVRYIVKNMTNNVLFQKTATGTHKGKLLISPHIPCDPSNEEFSIPGAGFKRMQFPVGACFVITSNKMQGNPSVRLWG